MLELLGWTALGLAALLAIPLRISLTAAAAETPRYQVQICWLFGLVRAALRPRPAGKIAVEQRSSSRAAKRTWNSRQTVLFVRAVGGVTRARQALRDLISSLRPQIEFMEIRFGFEDPADTGRAFALLAPLSAWLSVRYGQIALSPMFAEPAFAIDGQARFTIVPLQTLGILLGYAMSPRTLHALYIAKNSS